MFQIKWIWENMKGYRGRYILALFMTMIGQIMYLTNPIFGRKIVDTFIYNDNAAENLVSGRRLLIMLCLGMVVFTLVRTVIQFSSNMLYEVCSQGMLSKIRNYLFANVQKQDMTFYDRSSTGDIMTRLSGDLDMVRHSVAWIIKALLESIVLFTTSTVYFFILDPVMAICLLALTPLIFIISGIFRKDVGPKYVDLRERLSKLNTAAQEKGVLRSQQERSYDMAEIFPLHRDHGAGTYCCAAYCGRYLCYNGQAHHGRIRCFQRTYLVSFKSHEKRGGAYQRPAKIYGVSFKDS